MSETPITDAAECVNFPSTEPIVPAKEMQKLERENADLRSRLRRTHKSYLMAQGVCEELADLEASVQSSR